MPCFVVTGRLPFFPCKLVKSVWYPFHHTPVYQARVTRTPAPRLLLHLAEGDAYMSFGIENGQFAMDMKPPNIERPRSVEALVPGYERVHKEAVARIEKLTPDDLDREIPYFSGPSAIRTILWDMVIVHGAHHRGQLSLMCRLAGGEAPGLYGPNREEMAAMRANPGT